MTRLILILSSALVAGNSAAHTQDPLDVIIGKLVDRCLQPWPFHAVDMDRGTHAKAGQLYKPIATMPNSRTLREISSSVSTLQRWRGYLHGTLQVSRNAVESAERRTAGMSTQLDTDGHSKAAEATARIWPEDKQVDKEHRAIPLKLRRSAQGYDRALKSSVSPVGDVTAKKAYPRFNLNAPGIRVLSQEPPVYMVDDFLNFTDCDALISAAKKGDLQRRYTGARMPLDYYYSYLLPVFLLIVLSALPESHLMESALPLEVVQHYLQALGPRACAMVASLLLLPRSIELLAAFFTQDQGAEFKVLFQGVGSKWPPTTWLVKCAGSDFVGLGALEKHNPAKRAYEKFLRRAEGLFLAQRTRFEPVTVRRYQRGQGTIAHRDAVLPPDPRALEKYLANGGQRLVQCLCYLNDVPMDGGGATKFLHPSLGGLQVRPKKGSALVFFPAFQDGSEDVRMTHIGQNYVGNSSKWTCNVWIREIPISRSKNA